MTTVSDAQLVLGAITAYANPGGPPRPDEALSMLSRVANDAEALVLAVGVAAWLIQKHPNPTAALQEVALQIARQEEH
ncbi:MAG TPA: hypothetical protein VF519_15955 [Mycobacteriales bacterium]|jgi:hypothetical protein